MIDPAVRVFFGYLDAIDRRWRSQPGDEGEPPIGRHMIDNIRMPREGEAWARCLCGKTIRSSGAADTDTRNRALESAWARHARRGIFDKWVALEE